MVSMSRQIPERRLTNLVELPRKLTTSDDHNDSELSDSDPNECSIVLTKQ